MRAVKEVEELRLEAADVIDRDIVEMTGRASPHGDHLALHRQRAELRLLEQLHQARATVKLGT